MTKVLTSVSEFQKYSGTAAILARNPNEFKTGNGTSHEMPDFVQRGPGSFNKSFPYSLSFQTHVVDSRKVHQLLSQNSAVFTLNIYHFYFKGTSIDY